MLINRKTGCIRFSCFLKMNHLTFPTIDFAEYPYGPCMQNCGCQRFKRQSLDSSLCDHCNHSGGFHIEWFILFSLLTGNNASSANSQVNTMSIVDFPVARRARDILKTKVICVDRENNSIPKKNTPYWNELNSRNMIKSDVEIPTYLPSSEVYRLISDLFLDQLNGQRWHLFNASSGKLEEVPEEVS